MDDTGQGQRQGGQIQNQQPQQSQAKGGGAQGQTPNPQQPQVGGVGTLVKEQEPRTLQKESSAAELVGPSETEPKIHPELEKIGVRTVREFPEVGRQEREVGITESVPVKTEPTGLVQIPMTEKEARERLKHEKPTASIAWVAALVVKYFKKIHHGLIKSSKLKV